MRELPILFSTEMVKAILDERKSMTRRIMKPQPLFYTGRRYIMPDDSPKKWHDCDDIFEAGFCPYGQPGDRLWVRETWADLRGMGFGNDPVTDKPWNWSYKADIKPGSDSDRARIDYGVKWKPSIFMPKSAARIWLEVTGVRVERLQEMKLSDIYAEGIVSKPSPDKEALNPRKLFVDLWNDIVYKNDRTRFKTECGKYMWDADPWVWVIEFRRVGA